MTSVPQTLVRALIAAVVPYAPEVTQLQDHSAFARPAPGVLCLCTVAKLGSARLVLFSLESVAALYLFLARELARKNAMLVADASTVCELVEFVAATSTAASSADSLEQVTLIKLLNQCPLPPEMAKALVSSILSSQMIRVQLVLHKQANDIVRAIDCFLLDREPEGVFDFIEQIIESETPRPRRDSTSEETAVVEPVQVPNTPNILSLKRAVLNQLPALIRVDADKVRRMSCARCNH